MREEENLIALRPEISAKKGDQTLSEQFQNTTIRPILKCQDSMLV